MESGKAFHNQMARGRPIEYVNVSVYPSEAEVNM